MVDRIEPSGPVGVLALQGDFHAHASAVEKAGFRALEIRRPGELRGISALILPGGESTTMLKFLREEGLEEARNRLEDLDRDRTRVMKMHRDLEEELEGTGKRLEELLESRSEISRAVGELEATLEVERIALEELLESLGRAEAEVEAVRAIVEEFFATEDIQIPGVTAADVVRTLHDALEKMTYFQYDIHPDEVNYVFSVVEPLAEIVESRDIQDLLLPYCAKLTDCSYRYEEGCAQCGGCGIGDAFSLAEKYGLTPISIQSYEHLEETLERLKQEGAEAFLGSCCEPFYAKHKDDFERIGLPGILVDVDSSTCYDLGQEEDAYAGQFENQTYLKMDLLERVVRRCRGAKEQGDD